MRTAWFKTRCVVSVDTHNEVRFAAVPLSGGDWGRRKQRAGPRWIYTGRGLKASQFGDRFGTSTPSGTPVAPKLAVTISSLHALIGYHKRRRRNQMGDVNDWTRITFLESAENLKPRIKALTGKIPSTSIARDIGVCLQQGRLFFESAERSELAIQPLLFFYGTLAFAKALVVGRTLQSTATLPQSHGVSDVSRPTARLSELEVRVGSCGTFQRFNDVVAQLNRFKYFDRESMTRSFTLPAASSVEMEGVRFTVKEILSRIPGLGALYQRTYHEPANTEPVTVNPALNDNTYWQLRIDDHALFSDRASLKVLVQSWRARFPVLNRFRVVEAGCAWDNAIVLFANVPVPPNELDEEVLLQDQTRFVTIDRPEQDASVKRLPIESLIDPDGGSFDGARSLLSPHRGVYASKYSLHYLAMFMLSSLVRYRPQAWVHAITRTANSQRPADDQALTLLAAFMRLHSMEVPALVAGTFDPDD